MRAFGRLAGVGALLVLAVVAASAVLRLSGAEATPAVTVARGVHRLAATLAAVFVFAGAFLAPARLRAAAFAAVALTLALSIVGWIGGARPPTAIALFNQLGGVALAVLLAWLHGATARGARDGGTARLALAALALALPQAVFGALLTMLWNGPLVAVYLAHAAWGLATAACAAALGRSAGGLLLPALALGAPALGLLTVFTAPSVAAQAVHALLSAALFSALARAHARASAPA